MIVNRRTFVIKPGRMADAKALFIPGTLRAKPVGVTRPVRWHEIEFGAWNLWAMEAEFESLAEYERLTAEWLANHSPEFWTKYHEIKDHGGSKEIWTLIE